MRPSRRPVHRTGLPLAALTARAEKKTALHVSSEVCSDRSLFSQLLRFSFPSRVCVRV